jgi:hypothetical protein
MVLIFSPARWAAHESPPLQRKVNFLKERSKITTMLHVNACSWRSSDPAAAPPH